MSSNPSPVPGTFDPSATEAHVTAHPDDASAAAAPGTPEDVELTAAGSSGDLQHLPPYARSLLRIKVPVSVTLANSKRTIRQIRELVPGAILQFEKLCDEMLSLEVGGQPVAEGEAVKVGDKFGLRITSMVLPGERFHSVKGTASDVDGDSRASSHPQTDRPPTR